ncbi:uncharacterized protein BCR38DRAFT_411332 [Pseudomassariella vexata]|uniref:DUF7702 domain-containing protein n=1 Tax=Pseudomassariella vexata TaxID=1141098 RepID=A0A1Y2DQL3_9PEZI|nr:uncharacterized protein BCR38DRAFT_411332 [Pseudomassariella vexata]ORY61459.1 hypothetical protein BCR38DRAFT_411332 [Pseudomassariella vexata]
MADSLSTATLAIYVILAIPVLYLLVKHGKHGKHGFLGWLFLFLFCTIRIIGGALEMKNSSIAASIISSVGLSPLLLATAGILHEARIYRIRNLDEKLEWLLVLVFHIFVVGGVALVAAGSAKLQNHQQPIEKSEKIVKAGISILTVSWGILVGWVGLSFVAPRISNSTTERAGTTLLKSVCFSLAFVGIRVFCSLAALCTQKAYLNPTTGSLAIRVVLFFLSELIATLAYITAGFKTQALAKVQQDGDDDLPVSQKLQSAPYV